MRYFDTHAHIGLITEDPIDQLIIVQEARQEGVAHIVTVSNNLVDFSQLYENLKTEGQIYHSIGISPSSVVQPGDDWEAKIQDGVRKERVVAIGEIGLDYYRKFGDRDSQVELFIRQLELAEKLSLPVIIHNRDAGSDVLEILRERLPRRGGVLHCYSEDSEYARKALELNLYISFAGQRHLPQRAQPPGHGQEDAPGADADRERGALHGPRGAPGQEEQALLHQRDGGVHRGDAGDAGRGAD